MKNSKKYIAQAKTFQSFLESREKSLEKPEINY